MEMLVFLHAVRPAIFDTLALALDSQNAAFAAEFTRTNLNSACVFIVKGKLWRADFYKYHFFLPVHVI